MIGLAAAAVAVQAVHAVLPGWDFTYDMSRSTIFMPCNETGFTDPVLAAKFGIADFDWSNGKVAWANQNPMDCEERLVVQAAQVKAIDNRTKTFVYRNLVRFVLDYVRVYSVLTPSTYSSRC
jgi:hypothetical protein